MCPKLTILRMGEPLLGGPYHAKDVDLIRWKTAGVADTMLTAKVATGDTLSQSGFGSSRLVAASAVAGVLRRGADPQPSSFAVVSTSEGEPTTAEQFDAMFEAAGGTSTVGSATDASATDSAPAQVMFDLNDALLAPFTQPYQPPPLSPLEALKANFFGNPSVAGPNWFSLIFLLGGLYQCTRPEYIQEKGIDVFGLAPKYGIVLERTGYGALDELPNLGGTLSNML